MKKPPPTISPLHFFLAVVVIIFVLAIMAIVLNFITIFLF